jgi:predicted RNase H-like nuclease (RuvC/YqgF family)
MSNDPGADILASVQALVDERDALRARNQELDALSRRQGVVIAKFADAVTELQAFLDETQMIVAPEPPGQRLVTVVCEPQPEPAIAQAARRAAAARGARGRRAYSDADVHQWIAELRAGCSVWELHKRYDVPYDTIRIRVEKTGAVLERGRLVLIQESAASAPPEITADADDLPPFASESDAASAASS